MKINSFHHFTQNTVKHTYMYEVLPRQRRNAEQTEPYRANTVRYTAGASGTSLFGTSAIDLRWHLKNARLWAQFVNLTKVKSELSVSTGQTVR